MMKRILPIVLVLVLLLSAAFSCSAANSAQLKLVPGTANMVVQIQVSKVLNNAALQLVYSELATMNSTMPQTAGELLNQLTQKTGFDLSAISNAVLFADIESANETQDMYAGVIASGTFDESAMVDQSRQALTTSDYKGFTVYAGTQDKFEIVFLGQNQAAFGSPKAVRDVIDVNIKDQRPLSGIVIDTLDRVGAALISGAFAPPESLRGGLADRVAAQFPVSLKSFQNLNAIGFAIDQPGLNITVRADARFGATTSLQDARDVITGLISITKGTSQDQTIKNALGNIKVNTSGTWLSVQDTISVADFTTLFSGVQAMQP